MSYWGGGARRRRCFVSDRDVSICLPQLSVEKQKVFFETGENPLWAFKQTNRIPFHSLKQISSFLLMLIWILGLIKTEKTKSRLQAAKKNFLHRVAWRTMQELENSLLSTFQRGSLNGASNLKPQMSHSLRETNILSHFKWRTPKVLTPFQCRSKASLKAAPPVFTLVNTIDSF